MRDFRISHEWWKSPVTDAACKRRGMASNEDSERAGLDAKYIFLPWLGIHLLCGSGKPRASTVTVSDAHHPPPRSPAARVAFTSPTLPTVTRGDAAAVEAAPLAHGTPTGGAGLWAYMPWFCWVACREVVYAKTQIIRHYLSALHGGLTSLCTYQNQPESNHVSHPSSPSNTRSSLPTSSHAFHLHSAAPIPQPILQSWYPTSSPQNPQPCSQQCPPPNAQQCPPPSRQPLQPDVVPIKPAALQHGVALLGLSLESNTIQQWLHLSADCKLPQQRQASVLSGEPTCECTVLREEVQSLKTEHAAQSSYLNSLHQGTLQKLEARLNKDSEEKVHTVIGQHFKELATLKSQHARNIQDLQLEHEQTVTFLTTEHDETEKHLFQKHESQIKELTHTHHARLDEMTMRFEGLKISLSANVGLLQYECGDLRRREKMRGESFQRTKELQDRKAATTHQHLNDEIESLRTVIDLRNDEIHQLRRHNMELENELEQLPPVREQVKRLQQKMENLEAIISIKVDNERQMTEKHESLKLKYEMESKAKLRLSMNNEELVWRLTQTNCTSPNRIDPLSPIALSHSPTRDCQDSSLSSSQSSLGCRFSPDPIDDSATVCFSDIKVTAASHLKHSSTRDGRKQEYDEAERTVS